MSQTEHPRFLMRRTELARQRTRRILLSFLVAAIAIGIPVAAWSVVSSSMFDIDRVVVAGADESESAEIARTAGDLVGASLVDLDPVSIETSIELLPWVDEAEVTRRWPDTVEIDIVERVPVAVLRVGDGASVLVDADARVLTTEVPEGQWIELVGVAADGVPGEQLHDGALPGLLTVAGTVNGSLRTYLDAVSWVDGEIRLEFAAVTVRFGTDDDLDAKFGAIDTVLRQVDERCLALIDVRVPANPAVTRDQACLAALAEPLPTEAGDPTPTEPVDNSDNSEI